MPPAWAWHRARLDRCCSLTRPTPQPAALRGAHSVPLLSAGGKWDKFVGRPGQTYTLYSDGQGATLAATFGAGGPNGNATFIRAIAFSCGASRATATVVKLGASWVLRVTGNGRPIGALQTAAIGSDVVVQARQQPPREKHCCPCRDLRSHPRLALLREKGRALTEAALHAPIRCRLPLQKRAGLQGWSSPCPTCASVPRSARRTSTARRSPPGAAGWMCTSPCWRRCPPPWAAS